MKEQNTQISVLGLGYIGLPTASLLATKGFQVNGFDVNSHVVDTISRGEIHIKETDLDVLVKSAVNSGQLKASMQVQPADIFIIAVPTPFKENHEPDLSYVESATNTLADVVKPGNLVILESTSPIGTTEKIGEWLKARRPDLSIAGSDDATQPVYIAHCPERVLPGQILKELIENDRIIGGIDTSSIAKAVGFYECFVQGKLLTTNARTAEMAKLVENSFRDVNIAFANELSVICQKLDVNVWELIELANHHPRVNILQPGPGVGGHCIAVDPWFIIAAAPNDTKIIKTARNINDDKKDFVVNQVKEQAARFKQPKIACMGITYKPNIDDLRESPAIDIVEKLLAITDYSIYVSEPNITALPEKLSGPNCELTSTTSAIDTADIVLLLVDHDDFRVIDQKTLHEKVVIDTKGVWR